MQKGLNLWCYMCIWNISLLQLFYIKTPANLFHTFSAHLSRRLIWWAYRLGRPPSYIVVHILYKYLLLRNHWANQSQIPCGASYGRKVCSNGPGHMTKMAAMPIYGKNFKISSPKPKGRWPWNLVCNIGCSSTTKFAQMMTLGWHWPILRQGQIGSLMLLYGKRVNNEYFRNYCSLWCQSW